jgi:hypothetical protein
MLKEISIAEATKLVSLRHHVVISLLDCDIQISLNSGRCRQLSIERDNNKMQHVSASSCLIRVLVDLAEESVICNSLVLCCRQYTYSHLFLLVFRDLSLIFNGKSLPLPTSTLQPIYAGMGLPQRALSALLKSLCIFLKKDYRQLSISQSTPFYLQRL